MRLQFDDLIFDPDGRQLRVGGRDVHVSPKAFDLLALLVECSPRAVSKADIHARLWAGTFVSDSSLPSLVSEIRDAIGDQRREPRLIRTLHGFGYAFQTSAPPAAGVETPEPRAWLIGSTAEIALASGDHVLGRDGPGVVRLPSTAVSRRHARIVIDDGGARIEDLGSKNGTYVDDRRVEGLVPIADGSQVRLGSVLFTFRTSLPAGTTETVSSQIGPRPRS